MIKGLDSSVSEDVSGGLKQFLDYVAGRGCNSDFASRLDVAVCKVKMNKEWRREFMMVSMRDLEKKEEGREEGREEERINNVKI